MRKPLNPLACGLRIKSVGRLKELQGRPVLVLRFAVPSERYDSLVSEFREQRKRFSFQGLGHPKMQKMHGKGTGRKKLFYLEMACLMAGRWQTTHGQSLASVSSC